MSLESLRVAACLASSLDGQIYDAQSPLFGSPADRSRLEWLRTQADALLCGAGTARADRRRIEFRLAAQKATWEAQRDGRDIDATYEVPPIFVLCRSLDFDWTSDFWRSSTAITLLCISDKPSSEQLKPNTVDIKYLGSVEEALIHILFSAGPRILCEGGGRTLAAVGNTVTLDEYFITIIPRLIGVNGGARLLDGALTSEQLDLVSSVHNSYGEMFLRYRTPDADSWTSLEVL